ncbi:SRPBCC domain-containing protein [Myxococcus sp. AM009]|uniref:SRPBCC family protein n=1 Tax=unclassified Myxococcus TaxID=2648731 RepID=UPI001596395F|nr:MULTISPECIES: SRPBCC family protein [unclassified Myxococcus]NVI98538.1 SRPBCC domain-containing protein [Myxococcus sp. AM009]NVJ14346.1 SRPBCC domain-containing protein [Myxococcus sp. AM010]
MASTGNDRSAPVATAMMMIRRPVEDVFAALVDPAITTKFWFSRGSARLQPGGTAQWFWDTYGASATVNVLDFKPGARLRIEWGDPGEMTFVEWTFTALSPDRTYVRVVESGFRGDDAAVVARALDSTGGFNLLLAGAKAWLEHGIELALVPDHVPEDARHLA